MFLEIIAHLKQKNKRLNTLNMGAHQVMLVVKNLPTNAGEIRDVGSTSGSGRSLGRGHGNPLHGQSSLVGYSP